MMKRILLLLFCLLTLHVRGTDFAFKLYNQLKTTEGNLFFSPAGIELVLAMVREGAAGNTLRQMGLLLPETTDFPKVGNSVTLENVNAFWVDQAFPILETFQTAVTEKYEAKIGAVDFAGQPDVERETINQWVERQTHDKIKNILTPGSVTPATRLVLINAIYFKGNWLHAFEKEKTKEESFWISPEVSTNAQVMTLQPELFQYMENESFQCIELPYQGDEISMLIVLPKGRNGLKRIEEGFSADAVRDWSAALQSKQVEVYLPKFKIESQLGNLIETLTALGITDAFNPTLADFSGISTKPLCISAAIHKAFLQVDEKGTEAAAATGVSLRTAALSPPPQPKVFRVDHPFLFLIREKSSGNILFVGRVFDPSK
jgi:serpin B